VIPAEFEYHAPHSLDLAVKLLAGAADVKVLAGGMSLIPALKHRLAAPRALVDLARVPGLDGIEERRGRFALGARVTHAAIGCSRALAGVPIFAETARLIGDPQVRNRGTLAGSLVHADPAADWPAVFLALGGEVAAVGPRGERTIPASEFFTSLLTTAVRADEIVTEVRVAPERSRAGAAYEKLRQPASGFAIVGVAAQVVLDRRGRCEAASVAVTGANAVPFRASSLEAKLRGAELSDGALRAACAAVDEVDPLDDIHASAEYRRHLVSVLARRAILRAAERARA
jgi:carbon-monoxide dehydrogenase medium subunit